MENCKRLSVSLSIAGLLCGGRAWADSTGVVEENDEWRAQVAHAEKLLEQNKPVEAIADLKLAYDARQEPRLLYLLGEAHRRLGHAKEARDYLERFLLADRDVEPRLRAEVTEEIAELDRAGKRDDNPAPVRPHYVERPRWGMIGAGIGLLGGGYLASFLIGTEMGAFDHPDAVNAPLLVPLVGPFISGLASWSPYYSPVAIVVMGGIQATGLGLIIAGATHKKRVPVTGMSERLSITPYASAKGVGVSAIGRF
jgi:hypothetical protein